MIGSYFHKGELHIQMDKKDKKTEDLKETLTPAQKVFKKRKIEHWQLIAFYMTVYDLLAVNGA